MEANINCRITRVFIGYHFNWVVSDHHNYSPQQYSLNRNRIQMKCLNRKWIRFRTDCVVRCYDKYVENQWKFHLNVNQKQFKSHSTHSKSTPKLNIHIKYLLTTELRRNWIWFSLIEFEIQCERWRVLFAELVRRSGSLISDQ